MKAICGRTVLYSLCLLIMFCSSNNAHAQNTDSLKHLLVLHKGKDTDRVNLLNNIARLYQGVNNDSMAAMAQAAMQLAKELHYDKGIADAYFYTASASLYKNEHVQAKTNALAAYPLYERLKDGVGMIKATNVLAIVYYRNVQYDTALQYFNKILKLGERYKADDQVGKTLVSIGTIYSEQSNYPEAIKYFLRGLQLQEKIHDRENISITLSRLASTYAILQDNKNALEFARRCADSNIVLMPPPQQMATYVNVGSVYGQMKDNDKALVYFDKALAIAIATHNTYWKNICLVDKAEICFNKSDFEGGMKAYKECMEGAEQTGQLNIYFSAAEGIGRLFIKWGKPKEGIPYLLKSYDIMVKNEQKEFACEALLSLSEGYAATGDYKNAYQYQQKYMWLKDSLHNDDNGKKIQQLQFDYQLQKKQSQIELLNKDKLITQSRNKAQRAITAGLIGGVLLLLAILVLVYRSRQQERKNKELIYEQKEEIQQQATELGQLNQFKDKTFSVLSHDLRSPLNGLAFAMELFEDGVMTAEEIHELVPKVNRQLASLNMLIDNLLKWSKSHMQGAQGVKKEVVDIADVVEENIKMAEAFAGQKKIAVTADIGAGAYAMADAGQVDVVIRNLLNNALKFTANDGRINIKAIREENQIVITIADTGVGMNKDQVDKLFKSVADKSSYGTAGEKGTGIGLLLSAEFVTANGGTISADSTPGKGTVFTVTLPAA